MLQPPPPWPRRRDQLVRIRPALYRLVVVWSKVQPSAAAPADLAAPDSGCMRDKQPCAPYAGLRDQLRALAARQREDPPHGRPSWSYEHAGVGGGPAPRLHEEGGAGVPRDLKAYRALVRGVLALAGEVGAEVRYFSPWNEPNHPYFLTPQREACDPDAARGRSAPTPRSRTTCAPSWATTGGSCSARRRNRRADLARDRRCGDDPRPTAGLVCAAPVWSQHAYIGGPTRGRGQGGARVAPLPAAPRDLDHRDRRRACAGGLSRRAGSPASYRAASSHERLLHWHRIRR